MENDVLKNQIAPWQDKGRWYHAVFDFAKDSLIKSRTDDFILKNFTIGTAAGKRFLTPNTDDFNIIDIITKLSKDYQFPSSTDTSLPTIYGYAGTSRYSKSFARTSSTGLAEIYVYIERR